MFWTVIIFANKGEKSVTSGIFILKNPGGRTDSPTRHDATKALVSTHMWRKMFTL